MLDRENKPLEEKAGKWYQSKKGKIALSLGAVFVALVLILSLLILLAPKNEPAPGDNVTPPTENVPLTLPETIETVEADDEMRGVYIATVAGINFPSKPGLSEEELKKELDRIVEISRATGFDTVFFQVRPSSDAFYRSEIFPTSQFLVKNQGDEISFDPLSYLIEKAQGYEMDVVAWVNPYRITTTKSDSKEKALESLSDSNPAKQNPDWTVFFDGKLYYDPSSPEVRNLIADGVREICENYSVKGILYDDYFYPYPVAGQVFDDSLKYASYGGILSHEDWRRENVNQMVKKTYETVKSVSPDLTFGVSPFGIWQNSSSDPTGSDTSGLEAYSAIYCDARAWIDGGYVDYIAPQIYWERDNKAASFTTLTRWWSAQVDGTDVKLYISHAAYKVGDFALGADEITQQIRYSRSYMGVSGNIQYGFADIVNNTAGLYDHLRSFYQAPFFEDLPENKVEGIVFARPNNGLSTATAKQFVVASSDPAYPVFDSAGGKVGRTKSGLFSVLMPLKMGKNTLTLSQNGRSFSLIVNRISSAAQGENLSGFRIESFFPAKEKSAVVASGTKLPLRVTAPAGSTVTAALSGKTVTLKPTLNPKGNGAYLKEIYEGEIIVPTVLDGGAYVSVGAITYACTRDGQSVTQQGAAVSVIPAALQITATVTKDYAYLKTFPESSFYEDPTPASIGMTDEVTGIFSGYIRLGFGGYVSAEDASIRIGEKLNPSNLTSVTASATAESTVFSLSLNSSPPLDVDIAGKSITVKLFNAALSFFDPIPLPQEDKLFSSATVKKNADGIVCLFLELLDERNYYGFDFSYDSGVLHLKFRQPQSLAQGDQPLKGKNIVLDAGHGGSDCGALGYFSGINEEDLNLSVTMILAEKLKSMGANVILSRDSDSTVSLNDRMDLLTKADPDLSISVHHNSIAETSDANEAKGTLALYWSKAGVSLAEELQKSTRSALGSYDLGTKQQKLALCRNHRFPQALVELSFICSPEEYQFAMRGDYAEISAGAIAEGILNWYGMQENFQGGNV